MKKLPPTRLQKRPDAILKWAKARREFLKDGHSKTKHKDNNNNTKQPPEKEDDLITSQSNHRPTFWKSHLPLAVTSYRKNVHDQVKSLKNLFREDVEKPGAPLAWPSRRPKIESFDHSPPYSFRSHRFYSKYFSKIPKISSFKPGPPIIQSSSNFFYTPSHPSELNAATLRSPSSLEFASSNQEFDFDDFDDEFDEDGDDEYIYTLADEIQEELGEEVDDKNENEKEDQQPEESIQSLSFGLKKKNPNSQEISKNRNIPFNHESPLEEYHKGK